MAQIPITKEFIEALEGLAFGVGPQSGKHILVREEQGSQHPNGDRTLNPSISIVATTNSAMSLDSLVKKVQKQLLFNSHPDSPDISASLIALAMALSKNGNSRCKILNSLLESITDANATHFFILSAVPGNTTFQFKGFRMGKIQFDHFESICNKAGSDYSSLYGANIKGSFCLQSPVYQRKLADYNDVFERFFNGNDTLAPLIQELVLTYMEKVSRVYFEKMWDHLEEIQHIIAPLDCEVIAVQSWRKLPIGEKVSVYLNYSKSGAGYVVPETQGLHMEYPTPDSEIFGRLQTLEGEFDLENFGGSELANIIRSFSRYAYEGMQALRKQLFSESLMCYFIALEILFNERTSTSDKVCGRTAVLLHKAYPEPFERIFKKVSGLYDLRSRYVHAGTPVNREAAYEADAMIKVTLRNLLKLNLEAPSKSGDFYEKWLKQLDFIRAGIDAGQSFPIETLRANGIA